MNLPNILTVIRVAIIPFFLFFLLHDIPVYRLIAIILFMVASVTDLLDGYLARKWNQESKFGRFLDPLADKFLVIASLFAFYFLDKQIPLWMILAIISRDLLITLMRFLAIKKGTEVRTTRLAKAKTVFQLTSIMIIIVVFFVRSYRVDIQETFEQGQIQGKKNFEIAAELFIEGIKMIEDERAYPSETKKVFAQSVPYFLMLATTIVTILSGLRYLYTNYRVLLPPYYLRREKSESRKIN
ncbi:MAG: CDP-diacylglycerol--glycerol-3-phosphate 3-phosphatidyltransferase [Spirochaetia bacterium]|nr:CDP-diacylglycerol--glycerol-3-phosphate 3-phosphatidyltransferase [Spirochaetia bacterium]